MKAPLPSNEAARLAALRQYQILDSASEKAFDDITLLASYICQTPLAVISFVESDRQWFKSKVGLTVAETSRDIAFCAHAILQPDLMVVRDALQDERFSASPLVTSEPQVRFYAGMPLLTPEGLPLGTLCVYDRVPRELNPEQAEALRALARQVIMLLELRRNSALLARAVTERDRADEAVRQAYAELEKRVEERTAELVGTNEELRAEVLERRRAEEALRESQRVLATLLNNVPGMAYRARNDRDRTMEFVSDGAMDLTGYPAVDLIENKRVAFGKLIRAEDQEPAWNNIQAALKEDRAFQLVYRILDAPGNQKWVWEQGRGVLTARGEQKLEGFITDLAEPKKLMVGQKISHYRVLQKIGAGGMGVVFRAHDERLDRDVALKVLPAGALADEAARKRFRKEALALAKLNHPNIGAIYDFDAQDGVGSRPRPCRKKLWSRWERKSWPPWRRPTPGECCIAT